MLTALGWRDSPPSAAAAGDVVVAAGNRRARVRAEGRRARNAIRTTASPIRSRGCRRPARPSGSPGTWADPEMIAPGSASRPTPMHRARGGGDRRLRPPRVAQPYPGFPAAGRDASGAIFARYCVGCHKIDGDGGTDGPDLSRASGASTTPRRCAAGSPIRSSVNPDAEMPSFGERLSSAAARRDRGISGGASEVSLTYQSGSQMQASPDIANRESVESSNQARAASRTKRIRYGSHRLSRISD